MNRFTLFRSATVLAAIALVGCASSVGPNDGHTGDASATDTSTASCELPNDGRCPVGHSCPAGDNCNTCFCNTDGTLACTQRDCAPEDAMIPTQECTSTRECPSGQQCVYAPGCGPNVIGQCHDTMGCESLPVAPQYCGCDGMTFTIPSACPPDRPFGSNGACPTSADAGTDSARYPGALMVWRAPGGFAGTGPAIVVTSRGVITEYDSVSEFNDEGPYPPPVRTIRVPIADTDDLFTRWFTSSTLSLPHPISGGGNECYPSVYTRLCTSCTPRDISYQAPFQLLPEMESVWTWFDTHVGGASPRGYCH